MTGEPTAAWDDGALRALVPRVLAGLVRRGEQFDAVPASKLLTRFIPAALAATALLVPAAAHAKGAPAKGIKATVALGDKRPVKATVAADCANKDLMPTAGNLDQIRAAVLCLHNQIRQQHNLPLLRDNAKLQKAGTTHSNEMVDEGYFDHTTPDGSSFVDRIIGSGYVKRNDAWTLGTPSDAGVGATFTADFGAKG